MTEKQPSVHHTGPVLCEQCGEALADCECDECQLCEQEAELEPGTFTPHEHGNPWCDRAPLPDAIDYDDDDEGDE